MKDTKKETKLVPKLRFKEFEGEWNPSHFKKLFSFARTNSYSRNDMANENGLIHNIHYGDIHTKYKTNFDISTEETPTINSDIDMSLQPEDYVKVGDLIIADASEDYKDIGKAIEIIHLDDKKVVAGLHTILARPKTASNGFYGNLLKTFTVRKQLMRIANGISVLGISKSNLGEITLIIPIDEEQQKIATFLTAVDKRIEQLTKKKKLLEEYKKGVMQKIFNQEIRFKDENGNDFPDWEENLIENQFRFKQGVQVPIENQFQTPRNENFQRFIRIIDVTQPNSDTRYIEDPGSEHHISDNDIFMIRYGTPGVVAMGYVGVIANNLFRIIPKNKTLCKRFFYYLFKFSEKQFLILSNSTSMPAISFDTLKKLLIKVPSYKEQFNIATFLDEIEKQIEKHQGQITKLSEFKQGLLQQMFI